MSGLRCGPSPRHAVIAALLTFTAWDAAAADLHFQAGLDPVAFDDSTVKTTVGKGDASATLSGRSLTISGRYGGLSSAATAAHLNIGPAAGVPGPAIAPLTVSGGVSGQVVGKVTLTAPQAAALRNGGLSIVIDSEMAPAGNLWGWLLASPPQP
jgi:hypothetical protein